MDFNCCFNAATQVIICLMGYRTRKQIIIGTVYFLLLALIGTGIYYSFIYSPASCSDNIKNQNEEEVDCGGVCAACYNFSDIEVIWAKAVPSESGFYDLAARIRNPNPNDGLPVLNYHFQMKNSAGNIIGRRDGTTFILPNATKYVVETNFAAGEPMASVELVIDQPSKTDWQKLKDYQTPDIYIRDKGLEILTEPKETVRATGVVQNATDFDFEQVKVDIIILSSQNDVVGVSQTEVRTLLAGEGRYFSTTLTSLIPTDAKTDMEAEVNFFLNDNYIKAHSAPAQ